MTNHGRKLSPAMIPRSVNILGCDNGGGLTRDITLLSESLAAEGCTVFVNRLYRSGGQSRFSRAARRVYASRIGKVAVERAGCRPPYSLNIHLEGPEPGCFWLARRNVLIPNQEMFTHSSIPHLTGVAEVWAKTRIAQRLFAQLGCRVQFVGWSSVDRRDPPIKGSREHAGLHVAGSSAVKGTDALLDVWERNPNWPILRVLRRSHNYAGSALPWRARDSAPNIEMITERLDESTLRCLQNNSALYICPSQAEGFGHIILEGLSVGGVVITTDAPPMNELVTPDAGLLVAVERTEPMGVGERYFVNLDDLERKIRRALEMSQAERDAFGRAARARFEAIDQAFRSRIKACLNAVLEAPPRDAADPTMAVNEE